MHYLLSFTTRAVNRARLDGELCRGAVAGVVQVLGARREVIEVVLLLVQPAVFPPVQAVLAATPVPPASTAQGEASVVVSCQGLGPLKRPRTETPSQTIVTVARTLTSCGKAGTTTAPPCFWQIQPMCSKDM